jgi:hypothetical protein
VGLIIGFIFGVYLIHSSREAFPDSSRLHKHRSIRTRAKRHAAHPWTVYGRLCSNIRVCFGPLNCVCSVLTERHSFFMAIGTTIRTDSSPIAAQAFGSINNRPTILSRQYQNLNAARAEKN